MRQPGATWCGIIVVALSCIVASHRPNILFLVSDDMRPELGAYLGPDFPSSVHPKIHSPNLDKLASRSLLLKRAYVQEALCSPSRTSLLTGRRPDTTHVYTIGPYFRTVGGNFTTLPQYFKYHGYRTVGMGKVFHPGPASGGDDPISWTEPYYHAPDEDYWFSKNYSWRAVPPDVRHNRPLPDEQLANHAIKWLRNVSTSNDPFFLAVGLHKPHLPFVFPEEYLGYYPYNAVRLPDNPYAPDNMPPIAWSDYGELRSYEDIKALHLTGAINTTVPNEVSISLRRAYYAALSFADAMFGNIIDEIESLGMSENTIISFWGDHGWQLGEHGEWCKHTNFELATHAPMMVHIPGLTDPGVQTEQLTEFVDLYPTLVEAAGLPQLPLCPALKPEAEASCREGQSLLPLINGYNSTWKNRVFSQYPRGDIMGYTMRTTQYRFTEWVKFKGKPYYRPNWDVIHGMELYDHTTDPEENTNIALNREYQGIVKELSKLLRAGWRVAAH